MVHCCAENRDSHNALLFHENCNVLHNLASLNKFKLFTGKEKVLVFVEMKRQADFVGTYLSTNGFRSVTLHGGRYQEQREEALSAFRSDQYRVLVATSVAARGLGEVFQNLKNYYVYEY